MRGFLLFAVFQFKIIEACSAGLFTGIIQSRTAGGYFKILSRRLI